VQLSEAPDRTVQLVRYPGCTVLRISSGDGTNRLTRARVRKINDEVTRSEGPLIITGNEGFFSAGADLNEIAELTGHTAYDFAHLGQRLVDTIDRHPAPVIAAISGYCMGGGLDLALACDFRIAAPNAIFGHRGAALGIMTGWGGTQRLPRLIGKSRALQMFCAAEKLHAQQALGWGLIDCVAEDPVRAAVERISHLRLTARAGSAVCYP
jgi:enoyl-CoA hydratase